MTTETGTSYVWRRQEPARTPGWCILCRQVIEVGETMVMLANGPLPQDWVRSHTACAQASSEVAGKPQPAPDPQVVAELMEALGNVQNENLPELRVISDASRPRHSERHFVLADGAIVAGFTDEREATGACRALTLMRSDSNLRRAVLGQ